MERLYRGNEIQLHAVKLNNIAINNENTDLHLYIHWHNTNLQNKDSYW